MWCCNTGDQLVFFVLNVIELLGLLLTLKPFLQEPEDSDIPKSKQGSLDQENVIQERLLLTELPWSTKITSSGPWQHIIFKESN